MHASNKNVEKHRSILLSTVQSIQDVIFSIFYNNFSNVFFILFFILSKSKKSSKTLWTQQLSRCHDLSVRYVNAEGRLKKYTYPAKTYEAFYFISFYFF